MVGQGRGFSCGPVSIVNALDALGVGGLTEDEGIALCGTKPTGTSAAGIIKGLKKLGYAPVVWNEVQLNGMARLRCALSLGIPVILCVDGGDHWITAVGALGSRVLVADPASPDLVLSLDEVGLSARWTGPATARGAGKFYGIEVRR